MCGLTGSAGSDYGDGEPVAFHRFETRRVRKARRCEICREPIPAGHFAHSTTMQCDGTVFTDYQHLQCRDLAERVYRDGDADFIDPRTLLEELREDDEARALIPKHIASVRWAHGGEWVVDQDDEYSAAYCDREDA